MLYELINPSDPYTFVAPDREVAALVVVCLSPAFSAKSGNDETQDVPTFIFGGYEEWYKKTFGRKATDGLAIRLREVGEALQTFVLGEFEKRSVFTMEVEAIDDSEKREDFIRAWNDQRTSLLDIGGIARKRGQGFVRVAEAGLNEKDKD